ncbi:response regulator [Spongiibacter sp. KMU-158]|uniref:Response regulator n=1 Tax=Spongiibacter pelagi TaxID=2760804 RepID=A0A927GVN9_9GAMM|nr:adenylate/guanylate cyclase domain-containing protein [Spongiibacter pelagi]MBD2858605.1 response regulator [Spongiibacter pelagi]
MSRNPRHQRAFLNDRLQSLNAPIQLLALQLHSLAALPVFQNSPELTADLEKIHDAVALTQSALLAFDVEALDAGELARLRHDLRNHIGIVDGYSEILAEDCGDDELAESLFKLRQQSRVFQEQLEGLVLPDGASSSSSDPIAKMFKSFKRGLSRELGAVEPSLILVVDDNPSSRELLAQQLQRKGYTVLEAEGGRSGLETMRRVLPDLVLLDLVMPDMNGYDVLKVIREDEDLRRIPVVMVSGVQDEEGAMHCIDAGANDYLIKPVNATLLNARLSALLERKRWQDKEQEYLAELERSQKFIRQVFGRYLSDEIVERLLDEQDGLKLGGQRRVVTVLMADIRDFSTISLQLEPEACVALLNNYLGVMAEVIQHYRGTVDELMGDGILAIFGAPVNEADDCDRALACAVAMQNAMAEVNRRNLAEGLPALKMGIGLNTGEVVAGNIGSELRSKYGVVGHNVNLAARIESCTVGGQILVSPRTLSDAKVEVVRGRSMRVAVKGVEEELLLQEVLGVGLPYDLLLEQPQLELRPLSAPLSLWITLLNGKQFDESQALQLEAHAVLGEGLVVSASSAINSPIKVPADVAIKGLVEARCYGKLTAVDAEAVSTLPSANKNRYLLVPSTVADVLPNLK